MPAKARDLENVARRLGFTLTRQRGGHGRWIHSDGRATTIPRHADAEIGGFLFHTILKQMGITEDEFKELKRR